MKSEKITIHGQLHDTINYSALIKVQANNRSFITKSRKVVNVKSKTRSNKLVKVKMASPRHK